MNPGRAAGFKKRPMWVVSDLMRWDVENYTEAKGNLTLTYANKSVGIYFVLPRF